MIYSYTDVLAEFGVGSAHPGGFLLTKELLSTLPIKKENRILDCGCGTGQTASYLSSTFHCDVTAIDAHPVMIEKARNRFNAEDQSTRLIKASIEAMPLPDLTFDILISESAAVFTDLGRTLREYARVLKPEGTLLLNEMVLLEPLKEEEELKIKDMYGVNELLYTDEWLKRLSEVGFSTIHSCLASPVSSLLDQQQDRGNDFFPSDEINPHFHELLAKHQQLSRTFASKLGFLLVIAERKK
ncbi:class I SAM-dependent methyltransferase [Alkalicoccobacillus porphyridii]|uniref:Class I SAM-dependent methyltransferase n=1 Tax=Alkalicoccobacillus porphyridii TaxID=2597270 RepID=A0A554A0D0_9BACI|nr:class I SAM-dependent methyltransferase [Alkalicoccobacillus porphyridii]TSB47096.1 class I SAM-dependent methyltransferase [Alkalicoccobacillus porphyridii]